MNQQGVDIRLGDALTVLRTLPDQSVHCVVTSPPYWGLRDYGTGTWEGGAADCDHLGEPFRTKANINANYGDGFSDVKNKEARQPFKDTCGKCGALRVDQQLGLEKTPEEYIAKMVQVFRELRRVLAQDGTLWINIGDSYNNREGQRVQNGAVRNDVAGWKQATNTGSTNVGSRHSPNLRPKDLVGIPWMLAFALRADGWYLRSEIIWHKPNPMPESVKDRPTKSHEQVFLLSKSETYHYDWQAIQEKASDDTHARYARGRSNNHKWADGGPGKDIVENRNKRTVWTIPTQPFPEAHFATFPEKLIEPCILAGCPRGGTVLDPFCGSGTTGLVSRRIGCNFLGIELNPEYREMALRRLSQNHLDLEPVSHMRQTE